MRRMTIALLSAALVLATAGGVAARQGKPLIQGRYDVLRAGMYATALPSGRPLQILDRLCARLLGRSGCEPVSNALRRAIDDAVAGRIRWVRRRQPHGGQFWAFSPVVRDGRRATFGFRWGPTGGCSGRGQATFRRVDWTGWVDTGGLQGITCRAGA
jgi:hypothetical protein